MSIYQHFRAEEKPFIEKMMEWVELVEARRIEKRTDFLDPRQVEIVESLVNRTAGVYAFFHGGYPGAERVRALLVADEYEPTVEQFGLSLVDIENRNAFYTLTHRDYLGALMNLGIIRDKFGDLLVHETGAQLIIETEMLDYLLTHFNQVGRSAVSVSECGIDQLRVPENQTEEKVITTTSIRLDSVLSEILRMSRAKVQPLIKSGKVKVNWKVEDSTSTEIKVGDTLSVRGFGRFHILRENGTSKKGKTIFVIGWHKE